MSKITKSARGKPCTLRVSGYGGCSDPETVVFCHAPSNGKGMGKKSPDWWGAFGCENCHAILDGRVSYGATIVGTDERSQIANELARRAALREAWLRGIYETHQILIDEGLIQVAA